jgi:hypothetical protein
VSLGTRAQRSAGARLIFLMAGGRAGRGARDVVRGEAGAYVAASYWVPDVGLVAWVGSPCCGPGRRVAVEVARSPATGGLPGSATSDIRDRGLVSLSTPYCICIP